MEHINNSSVFISTTFCEVTDNISSDICNYILISAEISLTNKEP